MKKEKSKFNKEGNFITTKKHFKYFKKRIKIYIKEFGIKGFLIDITHGNIHSKYGDLSKCIVWSTIHQYKRVGIGLQKTWSLEKLGYKRYYKNNSGIKKFLDRVAFHEVGNMLINSFMDGNELREGQKHNLIWTLEKVIRKRIK